VAQIYGVGLITTRLTGVAFELGIFLGLGGILVCSFLGGMRAVTWTQVAQYIILVVAYLIPVVWLSVKQTGIPVPTAVYGYQLEKITTRENQLLNDPKEQEVIAAFKAKADAYAEKLKDVPTALAAEREAAKQHILALKAAQAPTTEIAQAEKALANLPRNAESAQQRWTNAQANYAAKAQPLANMPRHEQAFAGDPNGLPEAKEAFETSRNNFLALVFCLTVGTAALPHILTRTYTTPSVRQARQSVTWTLLFIAVLYFTAPALAVMVKYEVLHALVGTPFSQLPIWIKQWAAVDPNLLSITDINQDGIVQLGEMHIGTDIIVLATPEIAGLPYVISGMVAAGGLAAALSTADGLLLTIASALSHDVYFKMIDPKARTSQQVMLSKMLLLLVALAAAYVAVQKPADILFLVSAAFSFAAAALFPVLTLGIFWQRANKWGAIAGMVGGLGITIYYMVMTQPWLRSLFGVIAPVELWWGIQPISAGIFGVPVGFLLVIVVSLLTPPPDERTRELVEHIRYPRLFKD
jgi:cation/acetate symporter